MKKIYWIIVVIAVAAIAFVLWEGPSSVKDVFNLPPISDETPTSTPPSGTYKPTVKPKPTAPTNISYADALRVYDATRIQLGENCQATPNRIVVKNDGDVMIDNRTNIARQVILDGKTYAVAGYGFKIIRLTSKTLPKTINISCSVMPNVGQILLQAKILGE